ncbi:MAG: thioredoxin family protein, partial [Acidobacteriota bacterium]
MFRQPALEIGGRVLVSAMLLASACARTSPDSYLESLEWDDLTRDVYVDGVVDPQAQVLRSQDARWTAVLSTRWPEIAVVEAERDVLFRLPPGSLELTADRLRASSAGDTPARAAGRVIEIDDRSFAFEIDGRFVLVSRHRGLSGDVDPHQLWEAMPVWAASKAAYEPDASAVDALASVDEELRLTVFLGTWCGDSKREVPRLLKTLELAGNPLVKTRLIAVSSGFVEPLEMLQRKAITNVPTVIVERRGSEIGRFVETPAGPSIEADLAAIVGGRPLMHPGHPQPGELLASGRYETRGPRGSDQAMESWKLFRIEEGGQRLHSQLVRGSMRAEVWLRVDAEGRPRFFETTIREDGTLARTRAWLRENELELRTKGTHGGMREQHLYVPDPGIVRLSFVAADGWAVRSIASALSSASDGAKATVCRFSAS